MDKEKWINDTLNSIDGMNRAEPNPFLFPKILNKIKIDDKAASFIPRKRAILIFTSIIILAVLNLGTILYKNSQTTYIFTTETSITEYIPSNQNSYLEIFK